MPSPDIFNEPFQAPRSKGKTTLIVVAILAVVVVLGAGGYFIYQTFFAQDPQEVVTADLQERLSAYTDPDSTGGMDLAYEADTVLSGLGSYLYPDLEAYDSWIRDSSYTVGDVTVADDGNSATATASITHTPLIEYVEAYMGVSDPASGYASGDYSASDRRTLDGQSGDDQTVEIEVTYTRDGQDWETDEDELHDAVFAAYLPTDEELILSDVDWYFSDIDLLTDAFIYGFELSAGDDLSLLGISSDELADACFDGYHYDVHGITVNGDVATVSVSIYLKSLGEVSETFEQEYDAWIGSLSRSEILSMTESDLYEHAGELLLGLLRDADLQAFDIDLEFTRDSDGVWWLDDDSEDALSDLAYA